jgi:hypothetical protein
LVGLFAPQNGEPKPGLRRPNAIYASGHAHDGSHRPVQTVTPLAERLGQDVHRGCGLGDEEALAAKLVAPAAVALVAWHHEAIPKLVHAVGDVGPAVPSDWPDDRFDVVWTLTPDASGWRFAQVPQLLLAGDQPDPIG